MKTQKKSRGLSGRKGLGIGQTPLRLIVLYVTREEGDGKRETVAVNPTTRVSPCLRDSASPCKHGTILEELGYGE